MVEKYDVTIVGAGVVGCAIARELSRFNLKTLVLEKGSDVASGSSKANSGVVHAGFNNLVGSLKAKFCVQGNEMFESLAAELGVPYEKRGKLVIAQHEDEIPLLEELYDAGIKNGVKGLKIVDKETIKSLEPNIEAEAALFSPNSAITSPYLLTIAYAENAAMNGVKFIFDSEVKDINQKNSGFELKTERRTYQSEVVINSAGLFADVIARMVGVEEYTIYPCRGEYVLLDKRWGYLVKRLIYPTPPKGRAVLGVHITPTVEGNILLGPTAEYIDEREDTSTTSSKIYQIIDEAKSIMPKLPVNDSITAFSGIRAKNKSKEEGGLGDYIIENNHIDHFINLIGIESPGLTASNPIAKHVASMVKELLEPKPNENFNPIRPKPVRLAELSHKERAKLISQNSDYGDIVCRCEHVSKKEILDAYNNILGVKTLKGIKYRARAMMGRCQGGFCTAKIVYILINELNVSLEDIRLNAPGSYLFSGRTRILKGDFNE
ncbi:MAG: NAD(P)/FAD-dependent oxidoreductase [Candidatus Odinarchaeia archaeon]